MPSADNGSDWLSSQELRIRGYADKIEACIVAADWEALTEVLDSRLEFLQQLFNDSTAPIYQSALKRIAETILLEDAAFEARVEAEKQAVARQHDEFERSRRALQAYGNQSFSP